MLTKKEAEEANAKLWYLPHFGVINPKKPDKLRFVMDAASKSKGMSINDALLTGPDLLTSLIGILWNFRRYKIEFCGDIKEMFYQVQIRPEDRVAQRFLWRGMDRKRDPDVYEMTAMIFGSVCSPSLAQFVKNKNALEWKEQFPDACYAILKRHYVDDYLDCANSEEEATKIIKEVIEVHSRGGFEICNWICSSKSVLATIPQELRAKEWKDLDKNQNQILERVLGVWWNPDIDCLIFTDKYNQAISKAPLQELKPSKRQVLRVVMSIFDPCGFITNFTIKERNLLQDIWRSGIDWDEEIDDDAFKKWKQWSSKLPQLTTIKIPRCYFKSYFSTAELHVFSDASEKALSATAYLRIKTENSFQASLISAKTKVAPLKFVSIPRLELQAALIACRLGTTIKNELNVTITSTFYWTDSKIVLYWLKGESIKFKTFVIHRTREILDMSNIKEWHWVPTTENVADEATRDSSYDFVFDANSRWFTGPSFLRFFENCRAETKLCLELSPKELEKAETLWIRKVQTDLFSKEIMALKTKKSLEKHSVLYNLTPFMDENGLLLINGRINAAPNVSEYVKMPVILHSKHRFTTLLIEFYHRSARHQGLNYIVNETRQRYYIVNLKAAVKKVEHNCRICQRWKVKPEAPMMGQLPPARLTGFIRPFTYTGVDYFGPILVTVGRRHEKRYGVLFTCLTIRAIHLEIAHSLETDAAIMAIRRFIGRRGNPKQMFSDNGTNLRGAESELKNALKTLDQGRMIQDLSIKKK